MASQGNCCTVHIRTQSFGHDDGAVSLLEVFCDGDPCAPDSQTGPVKRVDVSHFPAASGPILDVCATRLEIAEVVDPRDQARDQVFFGATVLYTDSKGNERTVSIVGTDEVDPARGRVSWVSPIARALIGGLKHNLPAQDDELRALVEKNVDRRWYPEGVGRQYVSVMASGDRVELLKTVATKVRFKASFAGGGTGDFCLKGLLDTDEIPADCSLLVVAGPRLPFADSELEKINRFLKQGGRLLALAGNLAYTGGRVSGLGCRHPLRSYFSSSTTQLRIRFATASESFFTKSLI